MQPRTASGAAGQLAPAATRAAAVRAGKSIRYFSWALCRGGGTSLPGRVANRTRIMADAARADGRQVITNPEGSNLLSGIALARSSQTMLSGFSPKWIGALPISHSCKLPPRLRCARPSADSVMLISRKHIGRAKSVP